MRICGLCRRAPRVNDPMGCLDVPDTNPYGWVPGAYMACSACIHRLIPEREDISARPCKPVCPTGTLDEHSWLLCNRWCGVCKRYAHEDDPMRVIGVYYDDFQPPIDPGLPEGVYQCCSECFEVYRPGVFERWKARKIIPEEMPYAAFTFGALH